MGPIWPPCDEAQIPAQQATAPASTQEDALVLAATILGSRLSFIDGTVVNVALPTIQRELHATAVDMQWVIEAYALVSPQTGAGTGAGDSAGLHRDL